MALETVVTSVNNDVKRLIGQVEGLKRDRFSLATW